VAEKEKRKENSKTKPGVELLVIGVTFTFQQKLTTKILQLDAIMTRPQWDIILCI